jgi:AraC-like DNA-binding protein
VTWSGAAVIEPGRLIYGGQLGDAHLHAHAAVQIAVAVTGAVLFTDVAGRQVRAAAGVIPPGVAHAVDAGDATGLMVYLEPTGMAGRRLVALFDPATCDDARTWAAAARRVPKVADSQELSAAADNVLQQLLGSDPMPSHIAAPHASVRAAIGLLPELLSGQVRLTDVAKAVHLSADRLGRLFARDVGLSFPAYVRWARLILAMEVARGGGTITDAAHAAGFTDSSHANRAFHEMFGIAPIDAHRSVRLG